MIRRLKEFLQKAAIVIAAVATGYIAGFGVAVAVDRDVGGAILAVITMPIGMIIGLIGAVWLIRRRFD
jgi:ABC-type transport system involved in cytochrome c biogenesis permease component